tara:strand:+ start:1131 stop:2234 length:1104 start_codon:yes stop_codon:yes gene_type:complete
MNKKKVLWLVPEKKGGIQSYSQTLLSKWKSDDFKIDSLFFSDKESSWRIHLEQNSYDLIHIQHEYGLFGKKIPFLYRFSSFLKRLKTLHHQPVIATLHTVIPEGFRYPIKKEKPLEIPFRIMGNMFHSSLYRYWNAEWKNLDGAIVHSKLQMNPMIKSGLKSVKVIPHFVPEAKNLYSQNSKFKILIFGYFSFEKGQDLVIRAIDQLKNLPIDWVFAGGVRTSSDQAYFDSCKKLISDLNLESQVKITGFVPESEIDSHYQNTSLVITPFRETFGSGSIVQALSRAMPVLASDHPINLELDERTPGCLTFFKRNDLDSLVVQIQKLFENTELRNQLSKKAFEYAQSCQIETVLKEHQSYYREFITLI